MQEGMLFHTLYARRPGVDVEQVVAQLSEDLDADALRAAWDRLVERHAILRTAFRWEGLEAPCQDVHQTATLPFTQLDWRAHPWSRQKRELANLLAAERQRGFDLATPPLMRVVLIQRGAANYQFVWTFHHLLLDGHAIGLALSELFAIYEAICRKEEPALAPPRPYHDHLDWLQRQDWSPAEEFWRKTLAGFNAPTRLPVSGHGEPPKTADTPPGEQRIWLSPEVTSALKNLAQENGLTLNTLLQGAWALLLSRYSGERDVVFGAVRAGRHSTVDGAKEIVGLMINTVPVRVQCPPDLPVLDWLKAVRAQWVALRAWEHTPLVRIQSWSDTPAGAPLFETVLSFQDPSWDAALRARGGPWRKRRFRIYSQPNYPLALDACGGSRLLVKIIYDRGRLENAAVTRMLGHLKNLLEGLPDHLTQPLSQLSLLSGQERRQLLVEWNQTRSEIPNEHCVQKLFEQRAGETPDASALAANGRQLTYLALNRRANCLARYLRELGVGPDVPVAVLAGRSPEMVVGLLAILKAGGAYVPLDPEYPQDRLEFMLRDTAAPVVLIEEKFAGKLPAVAARVVCLDCSLPYHVLSRRDVEADLVSTTTPENLAYIIYTSGSTGTPKGVAIRHRGLVNLIKWHQQTYEVTPEDRATQLAGLSFDAAVWELWPYLTAGASIHFPDDETRLAPTKLLHWLAEQKITLSFVPTPLAETMLDEPWPDGVVLRALLTGGDKLHRWPRPDLPCRVVNHYGPTENTVVTTFASLDPKNADGSAPPIGHPITNVEAYVLDRDLEPVPVGVPGELFVGGVGLAHGYLNRPELTAEKFIAHPFSPEPGARLYRTGDRVRRSPDGNLEFLGRFDSQVKIRGHRIELGEVESVLNQHPAIHQCVALLREDEPGELRLTAYFVPAPGSPPDPQELRRYLQEKLPEPMVPAAFVALQALPLTPNGKVDRSALPRPEMELEADADAAPRTATEETIAGVWIAILKRRRIGRHDNFFDLGGHSLLATQVVSRVGQALQVDLPLRDLFDFPTVARLTERIDSARRTARPAPPIASAAMDSEGEHPLSSAQERLWFLEQLHPGTPLYNVPVAIRLEGDLKLDALERSLNEIIRRHGALRTAFFEAQGRPVARLEAVKPMPLPVIDLTHLPEESRIAEARRCAEEEARKPFDLARSPLLRVMVLRLQRNEHHLVLTMHHLVSDGWSLGIFYRELTSLYEAFTEGRVSPLKPVRASYQGFARWQRQWLQSENVERQLAYWKQQLGGTLPVLEFPADKPRPAIQNYRGAAVCFALPADLTDRLIVLSRREDATLFMVLAAAYCALLHRYTGQEDIVFGSPIAGRARMESEDLVGLFLNTLALRVDVSGDPDFLKLLQRVRGVALEAYAHQDLPFEKLVEALQPDRDLSRTPLFQTLFVMQDAPLRSLTVAGLRMTPMPLDSGTSKFDLTLSLEQGVDGLTGYVEYNTDLFEEATIQRLLGQYRTLLESILADPGQPVSRFSLLNAVERQRVLVEWNNTQTSYSLGKPIHRFIEERVAETPGAVAVVFGERSLTYRELDTRASQLAAHLRASGVGPDVLVAVCLERSLEMVVALLGVLKAGGAYVPLDPDQPDQRLTTILQDAKPAVLLTEPRLAGRVQSGEARVIFMDANLPHVASGVDGDGTSLPTEVGPDHLAYVIYTSGSTGVPKGVMSTHRGLCNRLLWMQAAFRLTPSDCVLQKTPFGFDVSVWEFFWPLMTGARLVLARPGGHRDGAYLVNLIAEQNITTVHFVPSMLRAFLEEPDVERCGCLRRVICSGEALAFDLQEGFLSRLDVELHNLYGPTEASIDVTCWKCERGGARRSVPIGRPIANTQIYILDRHLQPLPIGLPGELHIGGVGLARGYLNRPGLTAEKFIPHPFSQEPGARLYRTGDLARWLPDGSVEFLGRSDYQVKIRGHRIELEEIESVLCRHGNVHQCVVVARQEKDGGQQLVAYVAPQNNAALTAGELRQYLLGKLPEVMIPATFVFLDRFPLTTSGKVDRRALPPPGARPATADECAGPASATEQALAGIWSGVLGVAKVGTSDNFFDLGGHSLLATQVMARVRSVFQVNLPLQALFESPTVAGLAARIESAQSPSRERIEPDLRARERAGGFPLSFAQERLWFLEQLEPGSPLHNMPIAMRLSGRLNREALQQALDTVAARHEALRSRFTALAGKPGQEITPSRPVIMAVTDLGAIPADRREAEARRLLDQEARQPFDLSRDLLLRARLLRLDEQDHFLCLTTHHIVADAWSLGILFRDLAKLYEALDAGRSPTLPPVPIHYAQFTRWQHEQMRGETLDRELAFWRQRLSGKLPVLDLPCARPRPPVQTYSGATTCVTIPARLTTTVKSFSRREGITPFITLLAAFQGLLHRYAGQEDLILGTAVAGRTRMEMESLIGFFVNTLPLRTDFSGDPPFRDWLQRVRGVALEAFAHQDIPFGKLVEALEPERDLARSPIVQTLFIFQNTPLEPLQLPGLRLTPVPLGTGTAKFDLTVSVEETGGQFMVTAEYNTDLFDAETIHRLLGHYQELLERAVATPGERLSRLPLLTDAEQQQALIEWNATDVWYPRHKCVHHLFEEQVERTPDAVAVVCEDRALTYRELNERADQLAGDLRAQGVGPDVPVGVFLKRSPDLIPSLLAILKAGGAYLPLDPAYPAERLTLMMEDSQAPVLLTQRELAARLPGGGAEIVYVDAPTPTPAERNGRRSARTEIPVTPEHLAYLIYTSGSTGRPKGVMVQHRNVVNFFTGMDAVIGCGPGVWLAVTSICFDISVLEIFWTLTRGFSVVLHTGDEPNGQGLSVLGAIPRHGVSHLQCTPSLARALILAPESRKALRPLKKLMLGGEALPLSLAEQLRSVVAGDLLNMYGPTETTVWSATHRVTESSGAIPIGRPIANTQIHILDPHGQPVPAGLPGELHIGGEGVARGYWKRPELTRERFIPNPFDPAPGARLYRTGDLARYRADGTIEFLGRLDHQVKVRGHRIELGEIEAVLGCHPAIAQCVVVAREDTPGDTRLVAYLVPKQSPPPSHDELRRHVQEKLPEVMMPAAFIALDALPLTPNGKVDRKALPPPEIQRPNLETVFSPVQTDLEKAVADIWQAVLHLDQVGLHDNFFDLGGHSLLVVQVQAQLREQLGIQIPVVKLFEHPTVHALAEYLSQTRASAVNSDNIRDRARRQRRAFKQRDRRKEQATV